VTKDEFVAIMTGLKYVPPLGGPYVGASAATVEDMTATEHLFEVLADGKKKLTRHRMSMRLKQLANGEEGLMWDGFQSLWGCLLELEFKSNRKSVECYLDVATITDINVT
jgi:hypothetical protein